MIEGQHPVLSLISEWLAVRGDSPCPPLIGIAGAQGSGKSTLAQAAAQALGGVALSIDDVYLTRRERHDLARQVHPLFATRGPPGTHDLGLLNHTLNALQQAGPHDLTPLPRFDKLVDDRLPQAHWPLYAGRPRVILLEGWLVGATPRNEVDLSKPANALEADEDAQRIWRQTQNHHLYTDYSSLWGSLDLLIHLRAPSFDVVLDWRCEQEAGLMGLSSPADLPRERRDALTRFIAHYQGLTQHMLDGGIDADITVQLDRHRQRLEP